VTCVLVFLEEGSSKFGLAGHRGDRRLLVLRRHWGTFTR